MIERAKVTIRRQGHLFSALTFLIAIAIILSVGELAIRVLGIAPAFDDLPGNYVSDDYLPFRLRPNLLNVFSTPEFSHEVRHNSLGFRDEEHTIKKPSDTLRILALGDSFTYGEGASYEDTYLVVLEKLLNQHRKHSLKFEVLKMGIPRYFPEVERLMLQHYGLQYSPDLILVAFVPNDVVDTSQGIDAVVVSNGNLTTAVAASLGDAGTWLYKYSHMGRFVLSRLVQKITSMKHPSKWSDVYIENGFHEHDWKQIEAEYENMNVIARTINAKLVLVNIPQNGNLIADSQLKYPGHRLGNFSALHGIGFIDTLPAMAAAMATSNKALYWPKDGHCTGEGYHVVGEAIFGELVQKGFVP